MVRQLMFWKRGWLTQFGWRSLQGTCLASIVLLLMATQGRSLTVENDSAIGETADDTEQPSEVLTVGIGGTPPFLIRDGDEYEGFVLDLWKQIAVINNFEYELVLQTNTQDALDALNSGELDLLIGPFSITSERLQTVNFTRPFLSPVLGCCCQANHHLSGVEFVRFLPRQPCLRSRDCSSVCFWWVMPCGGLSATIIQSSFPGNIYPVLAVGCGLHWSR